jgi:glycosyltransferase involved in cell wall biosynthesis
VRLGDPNVNRLGLAATRAVDGWTARHLCDHFHAITEAVKQAAVRDLGIAAERITVIPRGRDPRRLGRPSPARKLRARTALQLPPGGPVLVTAGRQEFQKGQRFLIDAMAHLGAAHPHAVLLLAGREGNASTELRAAAERIGLNGRVRMLGHREDVPDVLAAADLFVFPSLYEGLGGALIEAMALGLPIVASDLPAIREVVEEGGNAMLVPPGSSGSIAKAVDALLSDPETAASMSRESRRIFLERFTLAHHAEAMTRLLLTVAKNGEAAR